MSTETNDHVETLQSIQGNLENINKQLDVSD